MIFIQLFFGQLLKQQFYFIFFKDKNNRERKRERWKESKNTM